MISSFKTPGKNGGRYKGEQQDMLLTRQIKAVDHEEAAKFMVAAMKDASQATKHYVAGGSTASMAIVTPDNWLTYTNVGDSPIWVVVRNAKTGEVSVKNIAKDHSLNNAAERQRLIYDGGTIGTAASRHGMPHERILSRDYMNSVPRNGLLFARSFGDKQFAGVIDKEDVFAGDLSGLFTHDASSELPNRVWVVVATDGMTEHSRLPAAKERLKACFQTNPAIAGDIQARELAKNLAEAAMENDSTDNIAVTAIEVMPQGARRHNPHTSVLAVMDGHGHGGDEVAEALKTSFEASLDRAGYFPITKMRLGAGSQAGGGFHGGR